MNKEKGFKWILALSGFLIVFIMAGILLTLISNSIPSLKAFGFNFFISHVWDPTKNEFGALPFIIGTLITSVLALTLSVPFSISVSILLSEYIENTPFGSFLQGVIEVMASIPSVIIGFWGLLVFVPLVRLIEKFIGVPPYGVGIFTASLVLTIMIIPYSAILGKEVIELVPQEVKEGALSLGATKFETLKGVILPHALSGILGGFFLSFGRAFGETMAVTMTIGNSNKLIKSIFSPGNTMASVIANEFTEATGDIYLSSLIEIALILFIISMIINILGRYIIKKLTV